MNVSQTLRTAAAVTALAIGAVGIAGSPAFADKGRRGGDSRTDDSPRGSVPSIPSSAVTVPSSAVTVPSSAVTVPSSAVTVPSSAVTVPSSAVTTPTISKATTKTTQAKADDRGRNRRRGGR